MITGLLIGLAVVAAIALIVGFLILGLWAAASCAEQAEQADREAADG